jgi:hypothetical protein
VFKGFDVMVERIDLAGERVWVQIRPFANGSDASLELKIATTEDSLVQLCE